MARLPTSLSALGSRSGLRRALIGYLLNNVVEIAIWLAVLLWAYAEGGASLAGLVAVAQLLPAAAFGPALSGLGDRMPRGRALSLGYLLVALCTAATTAALLLGAVVPVVVVASATATMALAVVRPFHFASLPQLARSPGELVSANALSSITEGVALFAGPLLAGIGAQLAGPWLVLATCSVLALASSLLCARLGLDPAVAPDGDHESVWRNTFEAVARMWRDVAAFTLLLVMALRFVIAGALDVLGVSFSVEVLGTGESGAGMLLSAFGVGQLLGGAAAAGLLMRRRLSPIILAGGVGLGLAVAVVAVLTVLAPAMTALVVAGVGASLLVVTGRTLLQRTTDDRMLARVFALQESTALLGLAIGTAAAPVLIGWMSPAGAFAPLGVGTALLTAAGFLLLRRLDARAVFLPEEVGLLRRVPFLSPLPQYELERLARRASWVDVLAGVTVVREGEPGDAFYVVDSGSFDVVMHDGRVVRTLGPGDGFGELALLWSVPRTATVTATQTGRLLSVHGPDFLAAVTDSEDGSAIAAEVTRGYEHRSERGIAPHPPAQG